MGKESSDKSDSVSSRKLVLPGDLLVKIDRASMANSLELRSPFLDKDLAEFCISLPHRLKIKNGQEKYLLRKSFSHRWPKIVRSRKKMGFGIPLDDLLRGKLRNWVEDHINPQAIKSTEVLDNNLVQWVWSQHRSGKGNWGYWLWDIVMLQAWLREH